MNNKWSFYALIALLIITLSFPGVYAENEKFSFVLTANGQDVAMVPTGEKVNIKLTVINNEIEDNTNYDLFSIQDYITYDREFFDLDEDSVSVMKVSNSGQAVNLFGASAISFDGGESDRVLVNRSSTTAQNVSKSINVVSFNLIVRATSGESIISHDTIEMLSPSLERYSYKKVDAKVIVGEPEPLYYTITSSAGFGGMISPSGDISVKQGENQTFSVSAYNNYRILNIFVDNVSIGAFSTYTLVNVTTNHSIYATFEFIGGGGTGGGDGSGGTPFTPNTYQIITNYNDHCYAEPNIHVSGSGELITVTVEPDSGFTVDSINITDIYGNHIEVMKASDNVYLFTMPESDVIIDIVYANISANPANSDETGISGVLQTTDHIKYINGYDDNTVRPNANMTRAEAAQIFYNLLLDKSTENANGFEDVPQDAWYYKAVNKLTALGIIKGYDSDHFGPNDKITREQFCAIATRFVYDIDITEVKSFSDVTDDMWSYNVIVAAANMGWINGFEVGNNHVIKNAVWYDLFINHAGLFVCPKHYT